VTTPVGGTRAAGRRKATRSEVAAKPFRRIPAVPTVVGGFAIAAAVSGALVRLAAGPANTFNGSDAFNFAGTDPRAQAISRDSEREALQNQVNQQLSNSVEVKAQQRDLSLDQLDASAQKRADQIAQNLWVLPTVGYTLTARFGQSSGLWAHFHTGLDFAAPTGTPIYAVANGVITFTGWDGSYGNKTVETLDDGTQIWYAHQSFIGVTVGQRVVQSSQTAGSAVPATPPARTYTSRYGRAAASLSTPTRSSSPTGYSLNGRLQLLDRGVPQ
jgi:murein DD-endopeptidase MepM/ murein hydrolase activator NlpD